jgi:signal transduction histidine kinase
LSLKPLQEEVEEMAQACRDLKYARTSCHGPCIGDAVAPGPPVPELAGLTQLEMLIYDSQKMTTVAQLSGGLAHDLNNMLHVIVSSLDLIERRIEQGHIGELIRPLRVASMSANRAAILAQRLLTFARPRPRKPEPVEVNDVLRGMADLLTWVLGAGIELTLRLDDLPRPALCDPHELENAVLNLVANGRDAMPNGGRLIIETSHADVVTHAATPEMRPYVRIRIADTGTGMAPDQIHRAFDPFYTTKPAGCGTGLGLAMVKHFVDRRRGQVHIESIVGRGTVVTLDLPCKHGRDDSLV